MRIEPASEAVGTWLAQVNAAADATLLAQAKHSWSVGANIPGKPRVLMPYAGELARYWTLGAEVAASNYEGCRLSA